MISRHAALPVALLMTALIAACGGDDGNGPSGPPADASALAFRVQPSSATAGEVLTPPVQVAVVDTTGGVVANATDAVTLALGANPSGAVLAGTVTIRAVNGVATFADLSIRTAGTGYTLVASAPGLTSATSAAFDIAVGPAAAIEKIAGDNQTAAAGTPVATRPAVRVRDTYGNGVPGIPVTFAVASGGGSITGESQTTNERGSAAVGSWTLGPTPGTNTLTVTSEGLAGSPVTFTATGTSP